MQPGAESSIAKGAAAKPVIGLCGAIGAGKSALAAAFGACGCLVISSDRLNHEVLRQPEVLAELRGWWGERVVGADGGPDRAEIARIVFADGQEKQRLESLVYPLIASRRRDMILSGSKDPTISAIVLDSPLLFESHLDRLCDSVVYVETSEEARRERLRRDRGWDESELQRREQWQLSPGEKRSRAEFVIVNDGTLDDLHKQARTVLDRILARHARP